MNRAPVAALGGLALLKLAVSGAVLASGVTAISDDDFSRVVIAQEFAATPRLDPTGSSWLPLPFWVYGGAMAAFGRDLSVARCVAICLGVLSVWLVWGSARLFGFSPRAAFLGAALAASFPYAAWLGVAFVPELPTAALLLFALAASARAGHLFRNGEARWGAASSVVAALAVTAAAASRYEAWPIAVGVAGFALRDALSGAGPGPWRAAGALAAPLALCFPLAWLAHGHFQHGDTWFFVRRVAEYKAALGSSTSPAAVFSAYPAGFVRGEPELLLLVTALVTLWLRRGAAESRPLLRRLQRPTLLLLLLLIVLMAGDARGGGPTHHPERALVCGWLLVALIGGVALDRILVGARDVVGKARWRNPAAAAFFCCLAGSLASVHFLVRRADLRSSSFVQRTAELDVGRLARENVPPTEHVAVATEDYGYFAVIAAFGTPEAAHVFADHDPRRPRPPSRSPSALRSFAEGTGSRWTVVPRSWLSGAETGARQDWGRVAAENGAFVLLAVGDGADENSPLLDAVH